MEVTSGGEACAYIAIGAHVKKHESCDQQIPVWLQSAYNCKTLKAKVWLFDPNFRNDIPLAILKERDKWTQLGPKQFQ